MVPEPLHPAVVHFPLTLALLVPLVSLAVLALIRWRVVSARAWLAVVALQALLAGSTWLAVETGEHEEEKVERVAERLIEEHEESGERFLVLASIGILVMGAGLLPGPVGAAGRVVGVAASVAMLVLAVRVGHPGGELAYEHGAASAYASDARNDRAPAARRHD